MPSCARMLPADPPPVLGSTKPRLFTAPLVKGPPGPCGCGCALTAETSKGFSAVAFAEDVIKVGLLPWQRWLLIHALELRRDGRFRYRTVLILVARQNGKTTLVEVKSLWKMFILRVPLVIGTAQSLDISEESWARAVEIAEGVPELASEIVDVCRTNGKKSLELKGGARWKIAAASRRGGRGLSGDDINMDELREHQTWEAWAAVTKTTMARRNSQIWAFSNAGDDKSVVLNDLHGKARAAAESSKADPSVGLFEWSVPDNVRCSCQRIAGDPHQSHCMLQDRTLWAMANPSLGYTITEDALASALLTDPEPIFRTECLCQRVTTMEPDWQVISESDWVLACDPTTERDGRPTFCLDMSPDRSWAAIAASWMRPDGLQQVEIIDHRPGTGWIARRAEELQKHAPAAWVVSRDSPAASEISTLESLLGIEVVRTSFPDAMAGSGMVFDGVAGRLIEGERSPRTLRHSGQEQLDQAVRLAVRRPPGERAWSFDRARPFAYLLLAATGAVWALRSVVPEEPQAFFAAWR